MKNLRLLIVDDEQASRYGIRRALESFGYDIAEADSAEAARAVMTNANFDLLLLDVNLPGISGLEFLSQLQSHAEGNTELPLVIIITAHGSERMAVQAVKSGAYDYISKPFELDDLRLVVKNAFETIQLRRENQSLRRRIEIESSQRGSLLGNSKAMQQVRAMIDKVADTDATVLVRGESGTGKELVARELHDRSSTRSSGAFIAVNCAALPHELIESELFGHEKGAFTDARQRREGRFEEADTGTLFLDEIGEMSMSAQVRLLRVLQDGELTRVGGNEVIKTDVRVLAASNVDLEQAVEEGKFRRDLYYRLSVFPIKLPPLKERAEDIHLLVLHFLEFYKEKTGRFVSGISKEAMSALVNYEWPGNVRELENAIERAIIIASGRQIEADDLPEAIAKKALETSAETRQERLRASSEGRSVGLEIEVPSTLDEIERMLIEATLEYAGNDKTRASKLLGIGRKTLYRKLVRALPEREAAMPWTRMLKLWSGETLSGAEA